MAIDFSQWIGQSGGLVLAQIPLRASIEWSRIQDKPSTVSFLREGTVIAPQTVRIEMENLDTESDSSIGQGYTRIALVFGIQGHATLPDTNIREWDTFIFRDMEFTVTSVNRQLHGQIQASCRAAGG